jgi:hypothetical protein
MHSRRPHLHKRLIVGSVLVLFGCKNTPATAPAPAAPPTRSFRMGFSGYPPRFDFTTAVAAINMWIPRADAAIISGELPWDSLLAGVSPESLLVHDGLSLASFYRSHGASLWYYLDPENGTNRAGDSDGLVRNGRSITEPAIQLLYRRYAVVADSILRPDHIGLALETNLIRGGAPAALYTAVRQVANAAAADVRSRDPVVKLSVSVQVEYAWGRFGGSYQGVETDFTEFPFMQELGLSSYPYLAHFTRPEDIPTDYYARLANGRTLPLMVTEGGWTSVTLDSIVSSPDLQRRYIVNQARILDACNASAVFQLTFTDIDLSGYTPAQQADLSVFAHLGLVDVNLVPKPALNAWDSVFAVRRTP